MVILRGLELTKNKLKYAKRTVMASSYSWKKSFLRYVNFWGIFLRVNWPHFFHFVAIFFILKWWFEGVKVVQKSNKVHQKNGDCLQLLRGKKCFTINLFLGYLWMVKVSPFFCIFKSFFQRSKYFWGRVLCTTQKKGLVEQVRLRYIKD